MRGLGGVTTWNKIYLYAIGAAILTVSFATHFRGGTISWRPVGGYEVEFYFKMSWSYGRGPGCTETNIGEFVDNPMLGNNKKDFLKYEGEAWMRVEGGKGNGDWNIETTVDLRTRSDFGRPNSSPVAQSQALYTLQLDCRHELKIPVLDPDGDKIRCRWAMGRECISVCNALPEAYLNETSCTVTFEANSSSSYVSDGYFVAALTIEDFPPNTITLDDGSTKTSSDRLSSVPMQFLIKTPSGTAPCETKPRFLPPTPVQGSTLLVEAGDTLTVDIVADNGKDTSTAISNIFVLGPVDLQQSNLIPDKSVPNTFIKTLTWDTNEQDFGEHIICSYASNDKGKNGDSRCFTIKIDLDVCSSSPCQNGGACHSIIDGAINCVCLPGYTGITCDTDIDDCSLDPCQNKGICVDHVNDYSCVCLPGYSDKNCSTDIDDCNPDPCQNNGNCIDHIYDYSCVCPPGYSDKNCSTDVDDCSPDPCQNNATCIDHVSDYSCVCLPGYSDKNCSTDIDDCSLDPCQNNATCMDHVSNYSCVCPSGYSDKNCSTDIDDCSPDPCENNATCIDHVGDYSCVCQPGYTDKNCATVTNFCQPNPCANGGICQSEHTNFTCQCLGGWQGQTCGYRLASPNNSKIRNRLGTPLQGINVAGDTNEELCHETTDYDDCRCVISPYTETEEDNTVREMLAAFIGFPIGLGFSWMTYVLSSRCCCVRGPYASLAPRCRRRKPPTSRPKDADHKLIAPTQSPQTEQETTSRRRSYRRSTETIGMVPYVSSVQNTLLTKPRRPSPETYGGSTSFIPTLIDVSRASSSSPPMSASRAFSSTTPFNVHRASINDISVPKKPLNFSTSDAGNWEIW